MIPKEYVFLVHRPGLLTTSSDSAFLVYVGSDQAETQMPRSGEWIWPTTVFSAVDQSVAGHQGQPMLGCLRYHLLRR